MAHSRNLIAGHNREAGQYDPESAVGLLGLRRGIMVEDFQMVGMLEVLMDRLNMSVRYLIPFGPRCLRWTLEMSPSLSAFEALADLMAALVW